MIGDRFGRPIPAHTEALCAAGPTFLTEAFRAWEILTADIAVSRIADVREVAGGSTGRKLLLSVSYEHPDPQLHTELFVKILARCGQSHP